MLGVDLTLEPEHRYVLFGPSGAGKSTLLRLLNRLDDAESGRILIGSTSLPDLPVRTVRTHVGLVFQSPKPLPGTVADNLAYPFEVRKRSRPPRASLMSALEEVGLSPDWLDREAISLSGGERQRLALATALGIGPEILALDEPTSALDPSSARRLAGVLWKRHQDQGLRTICVSHHRQHASWLGDQAIRMEAGFVVDVGPTDEVLARCPDDVAVWASPTGEPGP